ncbi:MAG: hypothetical protein WC674_02435 [Candidatus Krumholzibacteriia bacterium]
MKIRFAIELIVAGALALVMILPACRKESPPLDRNRAPETNLTSSPAETTGTDYSVHMYWRGTDNDGVVTRYMWYISDTLVTLNSEMNPDAEGLDWNPDARIADYLRGRFTTGTDTVITFTGFDALRGSQVNRQAFHIVAIDDGGKIDPTPARLQFLARVRGIPIVDFWTNVGSADVPYNPNALDTISMFVPFTIKFRGRTINNIITGYRWSYGSAVFPDYNGDGNPDWHIPADQSEIVSVELPNSGNQVIPSGIFNFKAIARDEAGALSRTDLATGVGVCRVVVNHDPDTRLDTKCVLSYTRQDGVRIEEDVNFLDGIPDTLPDSSLVRMVYWGWDDPKDRGSLQYDPPLPIRFQFQYNRWSIDETGARVADKLSPWYPLKKAEDTNPDEDVSEFLNRDSTTMRVGTFNYRFLVRSFDEQKKPDGTPAVVSFVGNFPPRIDSVRTGFWTRQGWPIVADRRFVWTVNDTIVIGWNSTQVTERGDTLCPYAVTNSLDSRGTRTRSYRYIIPAGGHDDRRDPPRSGIKGWKFGVFDPDEDRTYYKEGEWQFDKPLNVFEQDIAFDITAPNWKTSVPGYAAYNASVADSLVANPPLFLGEQVITVSGLDYKDTQSFKEGIRGEITIDEEGNVIPGDRWIVNEYYFANYARRDTRQIRLYLKLVK